jgi:WD40 repeat protein
LSKPAKGLADLGSDRFAGRHDASRGGAVPRVAILTRNWVTALAALAVGGIIYLPGPPQSQPAKQVVLKGAAGLVRSLSLGNDGGMLAATMSDRTIRQWRADTGRDRAGSGGPAQPGFVAAFSPGGATLAVGGESTLALCETARDVPRHSVRTEAGSTIALAFSRDGDTLAVAGERGVTLWDAASGHGRAGLRPVPRGVISLAFAPDGRSLATGGMDGFVRIWDIETGRERVAVQAHGFYVTSLSFSDDGRILASASYAERAARLWDVATGRGLKSLRGHSVGVQSVAFAPGGSTVAAAASDGTVRLWEATTGRGQATLRYEGFGACTIAFSPDGRSLAAGGIESIVWEWDVSGITATPSAVGAAPDLSSPAPHSRLVDDLGPGPRTIGPEDRGNIGEGSRASDPK